MAELSRVAVLPPYLKPWSSDFCVHQDHGEGVSQHRLPPCPTSVLIQGLWGGNQERTFLINPWRCFLLVWGPQPRSTAPHLFSLEVLAFLYSKLTSPICPSVSDACLCSATYVLTYATHKVFRDKAYTPGFLAPQSLAVQGGHSVLTVLYEATLQSRYGLGHFRAPAPCSAATCDSRTGHLGGRTGMVVRSPPMLLAGWGQTGSQGGVSGTAAH